jgi:DNA-binding transcriptional LysR family regulator
LEYPQLYDRAVDLIFSHLTKLPVDGHLTDQYDGEVLFNDRFCLIVGEKNKWARRRKINLAELAEERWISTPVDSIGGSSVLEIFRMHGVDPPKLSVTTYSVHLRQYMSADGHHVTALPESIMRFNAHFVGFKILPIELPMPTWPIGFVTLRNRTLNPAAGLLIACTREVVKSMTSRTQSQRT